MSNDDLILTPRIYAQDLSWNILPKNVIDTVTSNPIYNTRTETTIDEREITTGTVNNHSITSLPISDSSDYTTNSSNGYNIYSQGVTPYNTAAYGTDIAMLEGSYDIELETPIAGVVSTSFSIEGTTRYTQRGNNTVDEIFNSRSDIYNFVNSNSYGTEDFSDSKAVDTTSNRQDSSGTLLNNGIILDFTVGSIPNHAWITTTTGSTPIDYTYEQYITSTYHPSEDKILTAWNNGTQELSIMPDYDSWITSGSSSIVRQGPYKWNNEPLYNNDNFIPIKNDRVSIVCQAIKVDDYHVTVNYKVPVRYGYLAGAKSNYLGYEDGIDTYGFTCFIKKITITVTSNNLNEESFSLSYSRVNDTTLTTNVKNENILEFESNSFITQGTYWGSSSQLWTTQMSQYLLNKFVNGKHIVTCNVPIWWALQNNVGINSTMKIKLQNGTFINRNGTVCVFQVKNIEKIFKDSQFVYSLKLLET